MITFWIVVVIAILVWGFVVAANVDGFWFTLWFPGVIGGGFIACVAAVVLAAAHLVLGFATGYHWDYFQRPIVALTDERSASGGSFFLGSGIVGTSASYVFYTSNDDGSRVMSQVDADGVKVYEDSNAPYARYRNHRIYDHPEWVPWPSSSSRPSVLVELHVPARSIRTGINLGVVRHGR